MCVCTLSSCLLAATALFCTKLHFQYDYCITAENEKSGRTFLLLVHMRLLLFLRRKTLYTFDVCIFVAVYIQSCFQKLQLISKCNECPFVMNQSKVRLIVHHFSVEQENDNHLA